MSMPRICFIHYSCSPVLGGVELVIEEHARRFLAHGYPVTVVAARGDRFLPGIDFVHLPLIDSTVPANIAIQRHLEQHGVVPDVFAEYQQQIVSALLPVIEAGDIFFIHNILVKHLNFALVAALKQIIESGVPGKAFVNFIHDPAVAGIEVGREMAHKVDFPYNLIQERFENLSYATVSEERRHETAQAFGLPRSEIEVVPNGVSVKRLLDIDPVLGALWTSLGLSKADLVFLMPARIVPKKNIPFAVEMIGELRALGQDARLVVTGPPSQHQTSGQSADYFQAVKQEVSDRKLEDAVCFMFDHREHWDNDVRMPYRMVRGLYRLCDVMILPSVEEGFGIPILEAAANRILTVCSDLEVFDEICTPEVFRFKLGSSAREVARDFLVYAASDLRLGAFKQILRNHTWEAIFDTKLKPFTDRLDQQRR